MRGAADERGYFRIPEFWICVLWATSRQSPSLTRLPHEHGLPDMPFSANISAMTPVREITFTVEHDEDSKVLVASWDDPSGKGGITTQGEDLRELQEMIQDATLGYFRALGVKAPNTVRLHFATDPQLALA